MNSAAAAGRGGLEEHAGTPKAWHAWLLGLCTVLGLGLRVWGIGWGFPDDFDGDELYTVRHALAQGGALLQLNAPVISLREYPQGYFLMVAVAYGSYYMAGKLLGSFQSPTDLLEVYVRTPENLVVMARLISAVMGTALIPAIYLLGRRMFNATVGLVAALFICTSYPFLYYSHIAKPEMTTAFWSVLAFIFIYRFWQEGKARDFIWANFFIGLGVGTKFSPLLLFVPLLTSYVLRWKWTKQSLSIKVLSIASCSFLLGLYLAYPAIALKPWELVLQLFLQVKNFGSGNMIAYPSHFEALRLMVWNEPYPHALPFDTDSLRILSPAFLLVSGLGFFLGWRYFPVQWWLLTPIITVAFLFLVFTRLFQVRQLVAVMPFLLLLGTAFFVEVFHRLALRRPQSKGILALAIVTVLLQPLFQSIALGEIFSRDSTTTLARRWVEDHVPSQATLIVDFHSPFLNFPRHAVQRAASLDAAFPPSAEALIARLRHAYAPPYDVLWLWRELEARTPHELLKEGDFIIVSRSEHEKLIGLLAAGRMRGPSPKLAFYRLVETHCQKVADFHPHSLGSQGVWLQVYQVPRELKSAKLSSGKEG